MEKVFNYAMELIFKRQFMSFLIYVQTGTLKLKTLSIFLVQTLDSVTALVQYFSFVLLKIQVDFLDG